MPDEIARTWAPDRRGLVPVSPLGKSMKDGYKGQSVYSASVDSEIEAQFVDLRLIAKGFFFANVTDF